MQASTHPAMQASTRARFSDDAPWEDDLEVPIEEWTLDELDDSTALESVRASRGFDGNLD
jgi:hypothetical protein